MSRCFDCPRSCGADREAGELGYCLSPAEPSLIRAAAHFGEEPCLSGTRGSGAVFFTGCSLRCVYCQNHEILSRAGKTYDAEGLREVFLRLRDTGVHNINLVTPSHFVRPIAKALDGLDLGIPVVWNSSGYEKVESLRLLDGLVQIYMPDFKYSSPETAAKYSDAPDYPETAEKAIAEMYRQTGPFVMDDSDELLLSGVIIRHLILPGLYDNSVKVIDRVAQMFPAGGILFSLMSQYTPMKGAAEKYPELAGKILPETAEMLRNYLVEKGIEDGYYQDCDSAGEEMIPDFDFTGL